MNPNGFSVMKMVSGFCKDCTLLSGKSVVVFANGTRADTSAAVYLHHGIVMDLSNEEGFVSTCPGDLKQNKPTPLPMSTFLGAVDEFTQYFMTPDGKFDSGFYLGKIYLINQTLYADCPSPKGVAVHHFNQSVSRREQSSQRV
jgi:hypothetical protein